MKNNIKNDYVSLALPFEVVELEPEHFQKATEICLNHKVNDEKLCWNTRINALALIGFEQWLKERNPDVQVNKNQCSIIQSQCVTGMNAVCNLKVNDLTVCLISTDDLTEEFIEVKKATFELSEFAAHFYVLVEVLEEQGQVMIHGFMRYDQLNDDTKSVNFQTSPYEYYQLPISLFKSKLNKLLLDFDFLVPSAIPVPGLLPVNSGIPYLEEILVKASQSIVNLSLWLHGAFDTGWEKVEEFLEPPQTNFAFEPRGVALKSNDSAKNNAAPAIQGRKLLGTEIEKSDEPIALLVSLLPTESSEINISVSVRPTIINTRLPEELELMVLDETGTTFMQAQAKSSKDVQRIKLNFLCDLGDSFFVKVALGEASHTEAFLI